MTEEKHGLLKKLFSVLLNKVNSALNGRLNATKHITGSIVSFADTCPPGLTVVTTGNGTDKMPGMGSGYTIGFILNRSKTSGTIILFSYSNKEIYMINKNDSWDDTANY